MLAIVLPLIGLIVSLVALLNAHRRGLRAPGLTVAAVPIAAVLLVLQIAGTVGAAALIGHSITASDDRQECAAMAEYADLLAADGPASLEGTDPDEADEGRLGTWHSEVLELAFAAPDQRSDSTDTLTTSLSALSDQLDPSTGSSGKDWSSLSQEVDAIRGWRDGHCR